MSELLRQAEQIKLARVLGLPAERLDFLNALDSAEISGLRERITQSLFNQHHALFQRLALAGRLIPARINALISLKVFGPLLSARISGFLPAERAIKVAACLPTEFLADLCLSLDPRSAPDLLKRMPIRTAVEVAQVLLTRKEYVTMAHFVTCMSDQTIRAVVSRTPADEALVQIAFYVESAERLDQLIALLPDERLRGTVQYTTRGARELQQAGVLLLCRVSDRQKGRIGDAAISLGEEVLKQLVANVKRENSEAVLPAVAAHMSAAGRMKAAAILDA